MDVEPTDFKNTEYRKIRVVSRDLRSAEAVSQAARDDWTAEVPDAEWTRFWQNVPPDAPKDPVFILTFWRPRRST